MTAFDFQPVLEDELVLLSPLKADDFERLYAVASDPLIWEQHPSYNRYERDVFKTFFDEALNSGSAFLVFDKSTNELIGSTRFYDYDVSASRIAIGYTFLSRKFWGGKYNKAMKHLLLNHAFQYVSEVIFHIGITNIRSQKATMKIGAKKLQQNITRLNESHCEYLLTRQDWQAVNS